MLVHQHAAMYISHLKAGKPVDHEFRPTSAATRSSSLARSLSTVSRWTAAMPSMIVDEPRIAIEARADSELVIIKAQVRVRV